MGINASIPRTRLRRVRDRDTSKVGHRRATVDRTVQFHPRSSISMTLRRRKRKEKEVYSWATKGLAISSWPSTGLRRVIVGPRRTTRPRLRVVCSGSVRMQRKNTWSGQGGLKSVGRQRTDRSGRFLERHRGRGSRVGRNP